MFNAYSNVKDRVHPHLVRSCLGGLQVLCSDLTSVHVFKTKHQVGLNLGEEASDACKSRGLLSECTKVRGVQGNSAAPSSELVQNLQGAHSTNQGPSCAQQVFCVWRLSVEFLNPGTS